jgi:hypothetical protein
VYVLLGIEPRISATGLHFQPFKTIFLREITYPSIRNCPGAGRLSCMESFRSISSDAQLSTKLGTGILKDKQFA